MKNMKVIIVILIVLIIIETIIFFIKNKKTTEIPEGYKLSIISDRSAIDGPMTTLDIYDNEILINTVQYLPSPMKISKETEKTNITQSMKENIDYLINYFENSEEQLKETQDNYLYYIVKLNTGNIEKTFYIERTDFTIGVTEENKTSNSIKQKIDSIWSEIFQLNT